ncbi:MAG TPA: ArsC family reductase [Edaphocola sp.]|nr:ArsC family reductase [Edaphocola sp.]
MLTVFGIKNCNTMKKAFDWLDGHQVTYEFHDYKKSGISREKLTAWVQQKGRDALINRQGTTWRKLSTEEQQNITDDASAITLMQEKTSLIKRPLIEENGRLVMMGFNEQAYAQKWVK